MLTNVRPTFNPNLAYGIVTSRIMRRQTGILQISRLPLLMQALVHRSSVSGFFSICVPGWKWTPISLRMEEDRNADEPDHTAKGQLPLLCNDSGDREKGDDSGDDRSLVEQQGEHPIRI